MKQHERTAEELRTFGYIMGLILSVLGGILLWKGKFLAPYLLLAAAAFVATAILSPVRLRGVERRWLQFGEKMGVVMTFIILTLVYSLVITPIGLLLRLLGKDLLSLKIDRQASSYWVPSDKTGTAARPFLPY